MNKLARVGWISVVFYLAAIIVVALGDNSVVESQPSIVIQPIVIVVGTIIATGILLRMLLTRRMNISALFAAVLLLVLALAIHLPAYWAMLDDIAKVRERFHLD